MGTWIASPIPVGWRLDLARSLLHPRPSPFTTFLLQGADGKQRDSWGITAVRIVDLAVTPDFTRLVVVGECATGIPANHSTPPGRGETAPPPTPAGRSGGVPTSANGARNADNRMIVYDLTTKQQELYVLLHLYFPVPSSSSVRLFVQPGTSLALIGLSRLKTSSQA